MKKGSGLIALGLAAWAYWKYKMTPQQKENVKSKVSEAGKNIWEKVPQNIKDTVAPQKPQENI
ncbi:hypothetical protein [Niabella ginsengisoli]|uniref:YtxH domain-containing protein n=1 Tax=Niabella ginsengisoli TaxID=522298 RepID=A0ABS9SQC5_9BACT|nr:hypothetical protein [Niabella ginsengisoli]MCH5600603.1 hypothetical protein [Niabella ginsengisoli]